MSDRETLICPACKRLMLSPADRCSGSFLDEGHPANVAPVAKENPAVTHTDTALVEHGMWSAWSAAGDAAREAGALCDREQFDEVTYLMLVEARDLIAKAMRRAGFTA